MNFKSYQNFRDDKFVPKKTVKWNDDGSFNFLKGTRPSWTEEAAAVKVLPGQDRRHGLHGSDILTNTCEALLNDEIKRTSTERTFKRLKTNMLSRGVILSDKIGLDEIIEMFRKYSFSKVKNLLAGDGNYNKGIQQAKTKIEKILEKVHHKFFESGDLPEEIDKNEYKAEVLRKLSNSVDEKSKSPITAVSNYIIKEVVIPTINNLKNINDIDNFLMSIRDTTKIDIAFSDSKGFKIFNKKILEWDTKLKRAINSGRGLSEQIFNLLIGYRKRTSNIKC